jgi:hypothetical protein
MFALLDRTLIVHGRPPSGFRHHMPRNRYHSPPEQDSPRVVETREYRFSVALAAPTLEGSPAYASLCGIRDARGGCLWQARLPVLWTKQPARVDKPPVAPARHLRRKCHTPRFAGRTVRVGVRNNRGGVARSSDPGFAGSIAWPWAPSAASAPRPRPDPCRSGLDRATHDARRNGHGPFGSLP